MSNIYDVKIKLTNLSSSKKLSSEQQQFVNSLLKGKSGSWPNIEELFKVLNNQHLMSFSRSIVAELKKTTRASSEYKKTLKEVVKILVTVMAMNKSSTTEKYEKKMNTLFKKTSEQYHGTTMLPVTQGVDARLGDSGGECFGYVTEWAVNLLKNKTAFGVKANDTPPFKPVMLNSELRKKYSDLNHLAILTENISLYQRLQNKMSELLKNMTSKLQSDTQNAQITKLKSMEFFKSIANIANELCTYADENPEKIYHLSLFSRSAGHALGFCKVENKYHFFDSNSGWFRFENANDFGQWLPFYFKLIGYDKIFREREIEAMCADSSTPKKEKTSVLGWVGFTGLMLVLSPIIVPILIIGIAKILVDHYIIRNLRYALLHFTKNKNSSDEIELIDACEVNPVYTKKQLQPLDYLDLAINDKFKEEVKPSKIDTNASNADTVTFAKLDYLDLAAQKAPVVSGFFAHRKTVKEDTSVPDNTSTLKSATV